MINFLRSLFGYGRPAGHRTVAGAPVASDAKDTVYVRNSNNRLNTLHELYLKYKHTSHSEKLKEVLEKTKRIHGYLLAKKRVHELELFHIQHTDHFINTFSVIIEVHRQHTAPVVVPTPASKPAITLPTSTPQKPRVPQYTSHRPFEDKVEDVLRKIETEAIRGFHTAHKVTEMVKRVAGQAPFTPPPTEIRANNALALSLPTISIDTYSKIYYVKELENGGKGPGEIGFTSTEEEKDAFLAHVSLRLGIEPRVLSYVGNTILAVPGGYGRGQSMYAPVLNWNGCAYTLNLQDYRLFPVKTYHRNKF